MEKVYTLKEIEAMKEATLKAAFNTLIKQMGRKSFTARELSEMTGGLLSPMSIASRSSHGGWFGNGVPGSYIEDCAQRVVSGGQKHLAEIDEDGNIIKTFYAKLPEKKVNVYRVYN